MDIQALKIERTPTRRRRSRGSWPLRIIVLAVLAGLVFLFWTPISGFVDRYRLPEVGLVRVAESHPATVSSVSGTASNGHIVAARRAALSADTPGRIVELNVIEGSVVKKGDVVARLYSDEYAAALAREKANVLAAKANVARSAAAILSAETEIMRAKRNEEAARAQVTEAEANATLANSKYDRAIELRKQKMNSQSQVDDAKANLDTANARVASAQASLRAVVAGVKEAEHRAGVATADRKVAEARVVVARAECDQAAATLDKTIVRAPFDGVVVLKDAEVGEVVSPNSQGGSNARGSVCTMVDFASLEVQAEVQETSLAKVKRGATVNIYLDAWPDKLYLGKVDRIWPTANRQQATIEVRIKFEKPDQELRPDMGVRVVFVDEETAAKTDDSTAARKKEKQILVPESSIVQIDGASGAFVVEREVARFQKVELGERSGGTVHVRNGLRVGQRIVKEPPTSLQDGSRVRVRKGP